MGKKEYLSLTLVEVSRLLRFKEKLRQRECDIPPGRIEARMLNMFRDSKEHPEPFTVADVIPFAFRDRTKSEPVQEANPDEEARIRAERLMQKAVFWMG